MTDEAREMTGPGTDLVVLLDEMERELKRLELWSEQAPTAEALASQQPFCVDTLSLPQWLQFVFSPRLRSLIDSGWPLPGNCQIVPMAEMYFSEVAPAHSPGRLIEVLAGIDASLTEPR